MEYIGFLSFLILIGIFLYDLYISFFFPEKNEIWSPMTFVIVCLGYYIIIPFFKTQGIVSPNTHGYILLSALLYYLSFRYVFLHSSPSIRFHQINEFLTEGNAYRLGVILFVISLLTFFIFHGFNLSILNEFEYKEFDENGSYSHPEQYLTNLISTFCFSAGTVYCAKGKMSWALLSIIILSIIVYIIGGFRYRLLLLFIAVFTVIHLYPYPKGINYKAVLPIFVALYLLVGVMEQTRSYGHGLDSRKITEMMNGQLEQEEAKENILVYTYSAKVIEAYGIHDFIYFTPIINAALMPLPRTIFPWKPKGLYTREISMRVLGNISEGQAFCTITEGYVSFGWIGVILYGLMLGWLSKMFWLNYLENDEKMGAILLLALFNGIIYVIISRGYLAQAFTLIMYYIFIPFWLSSLIYRFIKKN